ncbi:hypothetical protein B0T17DRAFT_619936 [Bombardia bombarda]|uniref:Tyrosinase copper-binding domain-containing protein n=1 Tax=Bombardia bombarda TaxID=252184 RepID=A0AA39WGU1_9PEZI|nr:hypothetical protein B0T17DRAFT_619936 [Bombardia bombarda]
MSAGTICNGRKGSSKSVPFSSEVYCTYVSVLFGTWHRPCLLLFEQATYELMKKEVSSFDAKEKVKFERHGKRVYDVPLVFHEQTVLVKQPDKKISGWATRPYGNALYKFTMPGNITMGDPSLGKLAITEQTWMDTKRKILWTYPFHECKGTSRHINKLHLDEDDRSQALPTEKEWEEGRQANHKIRQKLESGYNDRNTISYRNFITKRAGEGQKDFESAEGIHDKIHNWSGGDQLEDERTKRIYDGRPR